MTTRDSRPDRIIHDLKNHLCCLLFGILSLKTDPGQSIHRLANLDIMESLIYEISFLVDELAAINAAQNRSSKGATSSSKVTSISDAAKPIEL